MPTWTDALFYIVFTGQIFLISYYFPKRILDRMEYVLNTYPPAEYPKLYPKSREYYTIGCAGFRLVNRLIMILGFVILAAIIFVVDHSTFADDGFISEFWPAAYGAIQFIPGMVLEFTEFGQSKMMRRLNAATTRKAALKPRRLFDYVSPALAGSALALIVATILFDLYVHDFIFELGHDTAQRALVLVGTNLLLCAVAVWILHGRKPNPHQSAADRDRQISASLQSFLFVSMVMSVFFMLQALDDVYDLAVIDATLMSAYFQLIAALSIGYMLHSIRLADVDFDVYRSTLST